MTDKKLPKMLTDQLEGLPQELIDLIKLDDADNGTRAEKYVAQKQREFVQMLLDDRRRLRELERERAIEVAELRAALAAIKLADRIDDAREIASAALNTLRMMASGRWAIYRPGRLPVEITSGEMFRVEVAGELKLTRMEYNQTD